MPWTERKLTERVGIELTGLRLGPDLPAADRKAVYDATVRHGVTVLPGQDLSDDDIYEFAASLEDEVVPACEEYGLGVLPYFPLEYGLLTGKYRRGETAPAGTRAASPSSSTSIPVLDRSRSPSRHTSPPFFTHRSSGSIGDGPPVSGTTCIPSPAR